MPRTTNPTSEVRTMPDRLMSDVTTQALHRAMDATALEQRLVAANLANIESPGYRPRHVRFEAQLRAALAEDAQLPPGATTDSPLERMQARVQTTGPAVDIEQEMTSLSEAQVRYEALVRILKRRYGMLGVAIGDGRQG